MWSRIEFGGELPPSFDALWRQCDSESVQNRESVKHQLGLLFQGSSVTACSTRRCSCVQKGNKCGSGCRCKSCAITPNATATQQQNAESLIMLVEMEGEKLVHDNSLRREFSEVYVGDEEVGDCAYSAGDAFFILSLCAYQTVIILSTRTYEPEPEPPMSAHN